jgi:hypothetical protein
MFNKISKHKPRSRTRRGIRTAAIAVTVVFVAVAGILTYGLASAWQGTDDALERSRSLAVPEERWDRSTIFEAFLNPGGYDVVTIDIRFGALKPELHDVHFILMPSFLADFLDVPHDLGLIDYFGDQERGLRAAGYDVTVVDTESEASIAHNAQLLEAVVLADDRPICIISHSKGGIDTLAFLLDAGPEVRERVVCWIAFQAPFAGSPVADGVASVDLLRWPSEQALARFGGSGQSLHELRTDLREDYLVLHAEGIADLAETITILSVAGAVDGPPRASVHYPATTWMQGQGIRSDGIVPTWSAVLPGTPFVVIEGLDHTGAVLNHWFNEPRDRIAMTKALLTIALDPQEMIARTHN